jgi:hypothetical protein
VVESFRIHMFGRLWVSLIIQSNFYCTNKLAKLLRFYYLVFVCTYFKYLLPYFILLDAQYYILLYGVLTYTYKYYIIYMYLLICAYILFISHMYIYLYRYIYICMPLPFKCNFVGVQSKMKRLPFRVLRFYL